MRRLLLLLALVPGLAWAQSRPTFANNGNTAVTAGTGTCTPATTTLGTVGPNDIIFLVATGEGDGVGGTLALTTANNFAAVGTAISVDPDADALEENPELDMMVWWVRGSSWTAAPVVTDSGDHTSCALHRFSGAYETGNPWAVYATGNDSAANDTSGVVPSPGTTGSAENFLIVLIQGTSNNATGTTNCASWTNSNLANITEVFDSSNTSGLGSGHCVATGEYSLNGDPGSTTVTLGATTYKAAWAIALKPGTDPVGSGGMMGFWP